MKKITPEHLFKRGRVRQVHGRPDIFRVLIATDLSCTLHMSNKNIVASLSIYRPDADYDVIIKENHTRAQVHTRQGKAGSRQARYLPRADSYGP
jgi:hypothetical protein